VVHDHARFLNRGVKRSAPERGEPAPPAPPRPSAPNPAPLDAGPPVTDGWFETITNRGWRLWEANIRLRARIRDLEVAAAARAADVVAAPSPPPPAAPLPAPLVDPAPDLAERLAAKTQEVADLRFRIADQKRKSRDDSIAIAANFLRNPANFPEAPPLPAGAPSIAELVARSVDETQAAWLAGLAGKQAAASVRLRPLTLPRPRPRSPPGPPVPAAGPPPWAAAPAAEPGL
jgi:hypothetical protein